MGSCCSSSCCGQRSFSVGSLAVWFPRISFGLVMIGYAVSHYRNLTAFVQYCKSPFISIPALASVAGVLAYIVPAVMLAGGLLFAVKQLCSVSKICILGSLGGIIGWAGLGVMLGASDAAAQMMPPIQNAAVLIILYFVIRKMSRCCTSSCCDTPAA